MADSNMTKNAIAAGFKALCTTKGFDKTSIADITATCSLNRQTFYYHFEDKYDLLHWIYQNEALLLLVDGITLDNWNQKLNNMLRKIEEDGSFYTATVKAHPEIFTQSLRALVGALFEDAVEMMDPRHRVATNNKRFYARFYAHGCCGIVVDWISAGIDKPADELAATLKRLAQDTQKLGRFIFEAEPEAVR